MIAKTKLISEYRSVTNKHMNKPYGYLIDSSVLYLPSQLQLISNKGKACQFRHTMSKLLLYLIQHAGDGIVTDEEIIFNVWERNNLSGTYNRLWQVMQNLKKIFSKVGIENELFIRVRGKGYYLRGDIITPLYTRADDINCDISGLEK